MPESLFNKVAGFWRMSVSKHVPFMMIKIKTDFVFDVSTMQFYLCYLQQLGGVGVAAGRRMGKFTNLQIFLEVLQNTSLHLLK